MPRSAVDATRFTATGPYPTSKSSSATTVSTSSGPTDETPQQKVARLRAAARNAKLAQESQFDRVVARGRTWADRAHRVTALSLIAATGIAGIVTVFALGDMILYNRKKRSEWMDGQHAQRQIQLQAAHQAATVGSADEDQILLINQERAAEQAMQARIAKGGLLKRTKRLLFSGLSNEEAIPGEKEDRGIDIVDAVGSQSWKESGSDQSSETEDRLGVLQAVKDSRKDNSTSQIRGGPLDQLADHVAADASQRSKSWTSWMPGR